MNATNSSDVARLHTQTIMVLGGITLADRIAAGCYNRHINPSITERNFPHDPITVGEWKWKVFCFGRYVSSEAAEEVIMAHRWQPGNLEHLLAFGEKYPEVQRKYPVAALGSSSLFAGSRHVPGLYGNGSRWRLGLARWGGAWDGSCRFLAVREAVSRV